jgi:hypothetical protein
VTALWLMLIAASAATLSYRLLTGTMRSPASSRGLNGERDDAEDVVAALDGPTTIASKASTLLICLVDARDALREAARARDISVALSRNAAPSPLEAGWVY